MATPVVLLNDAAVPMPSADPGKVEPASVLTAPVAIAMRRTQLLPESATSANTPSGEIATPTGLSNLADKPEPSTYPLEFANEPANVVTTPVAITMRRIRWLVSSVTSAYAPSGEMAMPIILLNSAAVPIPSANPCLVEPTNMLTLPVAIVMRRTQLLMQSMTSVNTLSGEIATPTGLLNAYHGCAPASESPLQQNSGPEPSTYAATGIGKKTCGTAFKHTWCTPQK
jgi:hypothetical protein